MNEEDLYTDGVPTQYQPFVDRLRKHLGDTAELNELLEEEESDDEFLYHCLQDALDEINFDIEPVTINYEFKELAMKNWNVLKLGAALQVLTGKGILSARNTVSYNDSGNLNIQENDTYGRYINYFNILIAKYNRAVIAMKRSTNVEACYGGIGSEYGTL